MMKGTILCQVQDTVYSVPIKTLVSNLVVKSFPYIRYTFVYNTYL